MKTTPKIKTYTWIIIVGLTLSGLTAFPLEAEIKLLADVSQGWPAPLRNWLVTVATALTQTNKNYPYLSYGTDWLAFAHLLLAILFFGTLKDPLKNKWIFQFAVVCCISVIPTALIAGQIRQIPLFWRFIDCSFGLIALMPLILILKNISKLEKTIPNEA